MTQISADNLVRNRSVTIGSQAFDLVSDDHYLDAIGQNFEPDMCRLFQSITKNTDTVFDIGANIGCTALYFAQIAHQVHAFEPSPSTFRYLEANVSQSGLTNIVLHNFGLGPRNETVELTYNPAMRAGAFISDHAEPGISHQRETIEIRKGDACLSAASGVQVIKIDVEGFELNVIDGLSETLSRNQPVVALELNHWCLNAFQRMSVPDFFDRILAVFPLVYAVDQDVYVDLTQEGERYWVMYYHITRFRYPNLVCAFHPEQLEGFYAAFQPKAYRGRPDPE